MSETTSSAGGGIGCLSVVGIVFVVLKLTHNIDWSWWWVLAPFWAGWAFTLGVLGIIGLVVSIGSMRKPNYRSRR